MTETEQEETHSFDSENNKIWLSRLRLTDFRNYKHLSIDLDGRPVVLTGGKRRGQNQSARGNFPAIPRTRYARHAVQRSGPLRWLWSLGRFRPAGGS